MKTLLLLTLIITAALYSQEPTSRGRGSSKESTELVLLSNYLSKHIEAGKGATAANDLNWNEIWNVDEFADIWSKTFLLKPWDRYRFLKQGYPVPPGYREREVAGMIFLIKTVPSDLQARGDSTTKEGLWWDFLWLNTAGEVKFGQFPEVALPSQHGTIALDVKEPNVTPERIAEYERKLTELGGVTFRSHDTSPNPGKTDSSSMDSPRDSSSIASASGVKKVATAEPQADKVRFPPVWGAVVLATIGLLWLLLKKFRQ